MKCISFAAGIKVSHKNNTKIVFKLYFLNVKRLVVVSMLVIRFTILFSQVQETEPDSIPARYRSAIADTFDIITDTTLRAKKVSPESIDMPITHTAQEYRKADFVNKKVYLVGDAEVTYSDIILKADSIVLFMETTGMTADFLVSISTTLSSSPSPG